jgi:hypothetical protein
LEGEKPGLRVINDRYGIIQSLECCFLVIFAKNVLRISRGCDFMALLQQTIGSRSIGNVGLVREIWDDKTNDNPDLTRRLFSAILTYLFLQITLTGRPGARGSLRLMKQVHEPEQVGSFESFAT